MLMLLVLPITKPLAEAYLSWISATTVCCATMARSVGAFVPSSFPVSNRPQFLPIMVHVENRIQELGIELPPAPKAAANYSPANISGNMLYLSGHLPLQSDGSLLKGKVGTGGKTVEEGYQAARQVGLNLIASLKEKLGDLDRVVKIVKLFGIVQSSDDFKEQHLVMNGCSDVLVEVFGKERGVHARSAIGTNTLPLDISVEVEAIVEISP